MGFLSLISTVQLLSLATICHSLPFAPEVASVKRDASEISKAYDYVVIGGGQSGLTVADRLTEDGTKTVLVVEYGVLDNNDPSIIFPPYSRAISPNFIYNLTAIPQPGLADRTTTVTAGKIVGGSSAVNGMFFQRGAAEDYDNWARLGNLGWDFEGLLPYFRKATTFTPPLKELEVGWDISYDPSAFGHGPINASFPPFAYPGIRNQFQSFIELGIKPSLKPSSGEAYGVFWAPSTRDPSNGQRSFARNGYYDPAKARLNYHLLIAHKVLDITISDSLRANGISFQALNDTKTIINVRARKEVVLAAGALHSPQILQRSGVGPKALLEKAGIQVKLDLPGVGSNFQDHAYGALTFNYTNNAVPNPGMLQKGSDYYAEAQVLWDTNRTGPFSAVANCAAFLPLQDVTSTYSSLITLASAQDASLYLPPAYKDEPLLTGFLAQRSILLSRYASNKSAVLEIPVTGSSTASYVLEKPLSRGSININTSDIYGDPVVDFETLTNPIDVKLLTLFLKYTRTWLSAPSNQLLGAIEDASTVNITSDADIESMLRQKVTPSFGHPSCTNAMMPLKYGGVVGSDLLVHGVDGLSIVDASVIPLIPGTHLCATVYAISEKAADLIKARADD